MKQIITQRLPAIWLILFVFITSGCTSLIGIDTYDKIAYQNATSIKVESLALMDKATDSYTDNKSSVTELKIKVDKAYEYAKGRPRNEIITKQWEIMKNPTRNLFGGFLKRWQDKGSLNKVFITEAKKNISLAFDQIIGLESGKIKPKESE